MPDTLAVETVPCAVCGSSRRQNARVRVPRDDYAREVGLPDSRSHWVVCEDCGLVYQSPRPGAEVVDDLYEGGSYHETRGGVPDHYVQYSLRRSVAALDWALSLPELGDRRGRALDVGCGIGGALVTLRERGFEVVGVEPDAKLAAFGRMHFDLEVHTGYFDVDTLRAGSTFDFAYSCHVWEHLADPMETTRAVHQVLVDNGGYFLIVVPTFRRARTLAWSCFTAPHTYMWSDVSLGNILRLSGFDVLHHRYASAADSELWLLARATSERRDAPVRKEAVSVVQRELAFVPLQAPLGLPKRAVTHLRTLAADPYDFVQRLVRWARTQAARVRRASVRRR